MIINKIKSCLRTSMCQHRFSNSFLNTLNVYKIFIYLSFYLMAVCNNKTKIDIYVQHYTSRINHKIIDIFKNRVYSNWSQKISAHISGFGFKQIEFYRKYA